MLRVWQAPEIRPTMDIDMLGKTGNDETNIVSQIIEILNVAVDPDGLNFDVSSIQTERITEDADYQGIRVRFRGNLDSARINMQIDIGFGDIVHPNPEESELPTMLGSTAPRLLCYSRESAIAEALQSINQRIATLEQELESLKAERDFLAKPHAERTTPRDSTTQEPQSLSVDQKVTLFKRLFKGRDDVFATRWQNSKGRSGYSIACHNEWKPDLCKKPNIKCNECPNRRYKALDDQAIYDHLAGRHIVGLYPLLPDNTCHLLAADFDKDGWQDSVKAMSEACNRYKIPHLIEISRSGNGAHLWVFFSQPVSAREARLLGFGLLDKAMEIHPNLSFESYDRLFPNQDMMPEGGFGNLIALPLQRQARQHGNSQFVDQSLQPFNNQWTQLEKIETVSPQRLTELIGKLAPSELQTSGQLIIDSRPPWEQGAKIKPEKIDNCPEQLTITLANHVYFKLDEIPAPLAARLRRLASFSNPVFFKTQALRFSTHNIPRFISCARIEQGYLAIPRGCLDEALELLDEYKITATIDDKREPGERLKTLKFLGNLKKNQSAAVRAITKHDTGVLHAPTAFGKTVTAIGVIAKRKTNTLILTHNRQLLDQWRERLSSFLTDIDIGIVGGGKKNPTGQIDIATYQSLINKKDNTVDPLVQDYGQIIVDECHHISAPRFELVLNEVRAKYILGLTATPDRQDGHQKIILMTAGPVRHKVKSEHSEHFEQHVVVTRLPNQPPIELTNSGQRPRITDVYRWLTEDDKRTQRIVDDVIEKITDEKHPLVLTERREHAELINRLLNQSGIDSVILRGAMRAKERKAATEQLPTAQVVVATGKYVGEGFDLPRLDTLFLAMPIAWKGSLAQYAGRIHREVEGKKQVTIYDYVDVSLPMLQRMFSKREKGYKAMGYQIHFYDENSVQDGTSNSKDFNNIS